ncbi:MAG: sialidase family protein [Vicinamibacterales bacterium]|jgi:hypothetical protein|nr:sialidase family protein [Vicinamibacterales bacterium]MDP7470803.1 sialidase family protein [Vicinamibacterales bacterium]MDP7672465.1 sialidase family protein [Vicinamibacterales bacterium]HJO37513.1 sialidase family protein [Vicinamibacterales bacterium]
MTSSSFRLGARFGGWSLALAVTCVVVATPARADDAVKLRALASPAPASSITGNLVAAESGLYLSWLEARSDGPGHRFQFAVWDGEAFSAPRTIRTSDRFFANWADFGSMLPLADGRLAAHWLEKAAGGTYQYDIWMSLSDDGGETWSAPDRPHRDGTLSEHGFVSLTGYGESGLAGVWLDGRQFKQGASDNEMALMFTTYTDGRFQTERLLDGRVCECCQTGMARTADGLLVAYRDRSADEVRDISIIRYADGAWTDPVTLHDDGWQIPGCPVNGPQLAADGGQVAVAWFTGEGGDPRVQVKFSDDSGVTFGGAVRVDDGRPVGRVDIEHARGSAIVSWLERGDEGEAEVKFRRVTSSGEVDASHAIARTGAGRASGFVRTAVFKGDVYVTWTEAYSREGASQVEIAKVVFE